MNRTASSGTSGPLSPQKPTSGELTAEVEAAVTPLDTGAVAPTPAPESTPVPTPAATTVAALPEGPADEPDTSPQAPRSTPESVTVGGYLVSTTSVREGAGKQARPPAQRSWASRHRTPLILVAVAGVTVLAAGTGLTVGGLRESAPSTQAVASVSAPVREAQAWITTNVERGERLLVPESLASELQRAGVLPADLVAYDESAESAAIDGALPSGWRDLDYVVTSADAPLAPGTSGSADQAIVNSVAVAAFGAGDSAVEIRRVVDEGAVLAAATEQRVAEARASAGAELAVNPAVRMSESDRALLTAGRVDRRIIVVLAAFAASGDVTVAGFPIIDGEQDGPIRQVAITDVAGTALASGQDLTNAADILVAGLRDEFAPEGARVDGSNLLLTYGIWIDDALD